MMPDEHLLKSRVRTVLLEPTTRCNLRCVYCAVSQPEYQGQDFRFDREKTVKQIVALHPREVQISGHGETTMLIDWHEFADAIIDEGLRVAISTNLSRTYKDEEIEAFTRLSRITVSCDTSDPEEFAILRRGGRLHLLEANIRRIYRSCEEREVQEPYIAINCTLSDRSLPGLVDLVCWAAALGVAGVSLVNLIEYENMPIDDPLRHPTAVDPAGTAATIEEARRVAVELGLDFNVMGGLEDAVWSPPTES